MRSRCHAEPFAVTLSKAKGPQLALRVNSAKHLQLDRMDGKCRFFATLRMTRIGCFTFTQLHSTGRTII